MHIHQIQHTMQKECAKTHQANEALQESNAKSHSNKMQVQRVQENTTATGTKI